jgi:transglutaminase-like putative cysteine protease
MGAEQIISEIKPANLKPTPILNFIHPTIQNIIAQLQHITSDRTFLQSAHSYLKVNVKPVYTLDEFQPASETLRKGAGSCSQRMACLEALSRAKGIGTRVRGLWIKGSFWYPRFRLSRPFIPGRVLLAWPQFYIGMTWIDFDELYGSVAEMTEKAGAGFSNAGETLFEAVEHTAVDFLGKTENCGGICTATRYDLSKYVVGEEGYSDTRDELFNRLGSLQQSWRGHAFEAIFGGRKSV